MIVSYDTVYAEGVVIPPILYNLPFV